MNGKNKILINEIIRGNQCNIDFNIDLFHPPKLNWQYAGIFHTPPFEGEIEEYVLGQGIYTGLFSLSDWMNGIGMIKCIGGFNEQGQNILNCYDFGDDFGVQSLVNLSKELKIL
ncbi:MAG: hypothetical protein ACTSR7_14515 [Promethearchaeota archaeon]